MHQADIFVLVGTSLQVYPAAGLVDYVPQHVPKYIIDKKNTLRICTNQIFNFIEKPGNKIQ